MIKHKKRQYQCLKIALLFLVTLGNITYSHASLSAQAQKLIDQATTHRNQASEAQKNSYYFTLGNAYVTNPVAIGRAIFEANDSHFSVPKFTLATDAYLTCKLYEAECFETILSKSNALSNQSSNTADDNDFILNRYYQFLNNPPAVTLAKDIIQSPLPNYAYLTAGQRLSFLQNLQLAHQGNADLALQHSFNELRMLRQHFAQADTLLNKAVFNVMIINQLREIVLLKTRFHVITTTQVEPLTPKEKDMTLVFTNEFYAQIVTLEQAITQGKEKPKSYQHDETVNAIAKFMTEQIRISQLPAPKFAHYRQAQLKNPNKDYPIPINQHDNMTGYILANIAIPDYQNYTERVLGLDNLIHIANFILSDKKTALENNFFPNTKSFMQITNHICMTMPTLNKKDENYLRYGCL